MNSSSVRKGEKCIVTKHHTCNSIPPWEGRSIDLSNTERILGRGGFFHPQRPSLNIPPSNSRSLELCRTMDIFHLFSRSCAYIIHSTNHLTRHASPILGGNTCDRITRWDVSCLVHTTVQFPGLTQTTLQPEHAAHSPTPPRYNNIIIERR